MNAEQASDHFWTDGACVLRGAVGIATVTAARTAVDSIIGSDSLADLSALAGSDEKARFNAGVDHWRGANEFRVLATQTELPRLVAEVLGTDRIWLYEDSVLIKEAGSTVVTKWHSDDGYFHVEGEQLGTLWVPLDPAPLTAGALRFLRGSSKSTDAYRPTLFVTDDPIPGTEGELPPQIAFDDPAVMGFDLEVGDCTIHHSRTLHAAGGNESNEPRRALSIRYCGDDAIVRTKPGAPMKDGLREVADGTPIAEAALVMGLPEATLGGSDV